MAGPMPPRWVAARLRQGLVIPAHPLALTARRRLDERRQRALTRYYLAAGAGGLAVGVHTTQFAIRRHGMLDPVLELAAATAREAGREARPVLIAGICGRTRQAVAEAELAARHGYHAGLLSLGAMRNAGTGELIEHARAVAEAIPLFGFYLQPAAGGRVLEPDFWRRLVLIENLVAIKIAPFDRYRTLEVVRAVAESGRAADVALYTGNDDSIVTDLLTAWRIGNARAGRTVRIVGGLLGQWAVWTRRAVQVHARCRRVRSKTAIPAALLRLAAQITDANAAVFDAANNFAGCIPGIHEVLRGQGLLAGNWCLDPNETLSPGQRAAIARVRKSYPWLTDDRFVERHRDEWLK
ncbi:MAG TPA: dihydrodipicolinate synthase family protein [Gemmatimonadales bacterium]|nr:dihydrodipicolinate synthase family protein [Gemmatimonadales bacterium]